MSRFTLAVLHRQLADTVPEPMLSFHLNAMGKFYMICLEDGTSVGFVKLAETAYPGTLEIVYAIGEDTLWGFGYGEAAVRQAVRLAFEELGARKILAKIDAKNERSRRLAFSCGFREEKVSKIYIQCAVNAAYWFSPSTGQKFPVGRHKTEDVPMGTLKSIKRAAGIL